MPDATISDAAGHTTITASDGSYTLSGLTAGTYALIPSKAEYSFTPSHHTVPVPPDGTDRDFVRIVTPFLDLPIRNLSPVEALQGNIGW